MDNNSSRPLPSFEAILKYPERLNLLYSPFRTRALNPEHYEQKLKFWVQSIEEYVVDSGRASFSILDVQAAFKTTEGKRPICLVEVVNHMLREKMIMPLDEWNSNLNPSSTWLSWSISSVKWMFTKALSYSPVAVTYTKRDVDPETQFVHLSQVQSHADRIYVMPSLQNKVLGLNEWKQEVSSSLKIKDIDMAMAQLKAEGRIREDRIGHVQVVKMPYPKQLKPEITAAEKSHYDIARTIQVLDAELTQLVTKQEQYENQARLALKEGKRTTAKHHLRLKKLAEKRASKLHEVLDNLYSISTQIEDSASDALVVSAYEAGKKALAKQLKDNNLNTNRVTEAMLDLQEVLEDYNDVTTSLSQPVMADDVSEIEEELAMLMEQDQPKPAVEQPTRVTVPDPFEAALRQLDDIDMEELHPLPVRKPVREADSSRN